MTVKISEQRTKEGYEITFFTDNKSLFRKARILLDELSSKERKRNMVCETEEEFFNVYCKYCGTQRCESIYDKDWREGCPHYKKFMNFKNKENNFTISEFDPILEMIELGKGIPPIIESSISEDIFCDYNPYLENIDCSNCEVKSKSNILNEIVKEMKRAKNVPLYVKGLQKAYDIIIGDD